MVSWISRVSLWAVIGSRNDILLAVDAGGKKTPGSIFGFKAAAILEDVDLLLQGLGKEVINIGLCERTEDSTASLS